MNIKKTIILLLLVLAFAAPTVTFLKKPEATPAFGSAVETYIEVSYMVEKHPTTDMLAHKILHALTVEQKTMDDIYVFIYEETNGNPPDIFKEYYDGYTP